MGRFLSSVLLHKKLSYLLLMAFLLFFFNTNIMVVKADGEIPTISDATIHANGLPILIEEGSEAGTTSIRYDSDGDGIYESYVDEEKTKDTITVYNVYGGKMGEYNNVNVENSSITMTGGKVGTIRATGDKKGEGASGVSGEALISISGGEVANIIGGGPAGYSWENTGSAYVKKCIIEISGGVIGTVTGGGSSAREATSVVEESEIYISGGTVNLLNAGGSAANDAYTYVNKSTIVISGGNVGHIQNIAEYRYNAALNTVNHQTFIISGGSVKNIELNSGTAAYNMPVPIGADGLTSVYKTTVTLMNGVSADVSASVNSLKIKNQGMPEVTDYNTSGVTTDKDGKIYVWLPSGTTIVSAVNDLSKYFNEANDEIVTGSDNLSEGILTKLITIPTSKFGDDIPVYTGETLTGLDNVDISESAPYTVSDTSDAVMQTDAGNYSTTFVLKDGFRWENETTDNVTVEWSIKKAEQATPTGITANDESEYNKNDGTISGLTDKMEYAKESADGEELNYNPVSGLSSEGILSGLAPGKYYIRYAGDKNHIESSAVDVTIAAAERPTRILTIMSYDGTKKLGEVETGENTSQTPGYYTFIAVLTAEYNDYAIFTKANGNEICGKYQYDDTNTNLIGKYIEIEDDYTVYAMEPVYMGDKIMNYDLTDDKKVEIICDLSSDYNIAMTNLDSDSSNDFLVWFYFVTTIEQKFSSKEFGNFGSLSNKEYKEKICELSPYYVTPCALTDIRLTEKDRIISNEFFGESAVIPHLSLEEDSESVMKLNLSMVQKDGKDTYKLTLSSVDRKEIAESVAVNLGRYPKYGPGALFKNGAIKNEIFNRCIMNVKYGSTVKEESSTETSTTETPTTEKPSTDPQSTDPKDGSDDDLIKISGVGTISADGKTLTDTSGVKWRIADTVTKDDLKKNLYVAFKDNGKYKITKLIKKNGKITGGTVTYMAPYNKNCTRMTAPMTVKLGQVTLTVTALAPNAFKDCKKLKKATIGGGVTSIGKGAFMNCTSLVTVNIRSGNLKTIGANAFLKCKSLKKFTYKGTKLSKIGANAFKGTTSKVTFKLKKSKLESYTKKLKKAGASKKAKYTK
ncbi:MAG: leucine-rich repeat domain-containing protein [Eubacterium sp.]|nr:leucine-rich repeat domain-containing protein [Eubacterium sp.]